MCGIAGFTYPMGLPPGEARARYEPPLRQMTAALYHRGPDALNAVVLDGAALGHARLSIVDIASGHQPMRDPATGIELVFNGEIFNHVELREQLSARHAFRTRSDTEVILAAFLARGIGCVEDFNGQFAFAVYDPRDGSLWLARDRYGKRPLYYASNARGFYFASEAKALFAAGALSPKLDPKALYTTLHFWAPAPDASAFTDVQALPPGHVAKLERGKALEVREYWRPELGDERVDRSMTEARALDELGGLLNDAIRLRLRADVPVAAYLSGGIDSSLICALAQRQLAGTLQTFSVNFAHQRYDEGAFQREVAEALKTEHHAVQVSDTEIGALLPRVVEHAENVLLRSAPAPFFRLSGLVLQHRTKVVLTGEGADEVFLGYDLFKETAVRAFWARQPDSACRPRLFQKLYPYLGMASQSPEMLKQFYGIGLDRPDSLEFSHRIRWTNSGRIGRFLSPAFKERLDGFDPIRAFLDTVPPAVKTWRPLARAQYLEIRTLLGGYLLSSQGDRMLMSNSIEGRFPFLDHRLLELSSRLPDRLKLNVLREKYLLKRYAAAILPKLVTERHKFPYRAPIAEALLGPGAPSWSRELLSPEALEAVGIFDSKKIPALVARLRKATTPPSEADNMALMAAATTQLLSQAFHAAAPPQKSSDVVVR
ncbi:MAG: asparagine synthase (glutamine-hydrolyzing) [Myxococcota bacterium]|nr:asparagine synthase (glutamine-hydrolyzing) [Myxococcota bacterium]